MMNKELLMDLIRKDIEKSCQILLSIKPAIQHKYFEEEFDKIMMYAEKNGDFHLVN